MCTTKYKKMRIIQVKTHKSCIIKKLSNNKISFVEFILNSRQFDMYVWKKYMNRTVRNFACTMHIDRENVQE